jgi:hypothetical protein
MSIRSLGWGKKGLLLLGGCLLATAASPLVSYSCGRDAAGTVSCRVTSHALGIVPYWWTTLSPVVEASSDFTPRRRQRAISSGGWATVPSVTVNRIRAKSDAVAREWTTHASTGADPGTISIAVNALVAGERTEPFLAWQANVMVVFAVFVVAIPFAAAMLSRPFCERFVPRDRWLRVIERTYVAALVVGLAVWAAIALGSIPAALARPLGLPLG